jgi:hypothetical protein
MLKCTMTTGCVPSARTAEHYVIIVEYVVIVSVSNFPCYRFCRYVALNIQRFTSKEMDCPFITQNHTTFRKLTLLQPSGNWFSLTNTMAAQPRGSNINIKSQSGMMLDKFHLLISHFISLEVHLNFIHSFYSPSSKCTLPKGVSWKRFCLHSLWLASKLQVKSIVTANNHHLTNNILICMNNLFRL